MKILTRIKRRTGADMLADHGHDYDDGVWHGVLCTSLALSSQLRRALPRPDAPCLRGVREGDMKIWRRRYEYKLSDE